MMASKRSAGVTPEVNLRIESTQASMADLHTVNRCHTRLHLGEKAHKQGIHPDLKGRTEITSRPYKKDLCLPKKIYFLKKARYAPGSLM